jgi:glycosyltransferase involved in cell wall biosynthesis
MNGLTVGSTFKRRNITLKRAKHPPARMEHGLALAPGDSVFLAGASWNFDEYLWNLAQERLRRGIVICHFIHDLIPILTPEHVGDEVPERFGRWLKHLSANTDYFLTNSQATKRDLDAWLDENNVGVPTAVLPLAHQFADSSRHAPLEDAPGDEPVRARVRNAARLPFVLCVGTIESRKNIWTLANVWKRIHAQLGGATPRLIFAGKQGGGLNEDFEDFLKGTGSLYGFIRVVERPNDAELAFLYRKCLFSVFPSYKEGWGLPVGESLWLGRPVVCSNTSSMPEVGGALADYIDPTSWESIERALLRMITDADYRERRTAEIAEAPLRTWSDVADALWHVLTSTIESRQQRPSRFPRSSVVGLQGAD